LERLGFGFAYPSGPANARLRFVGEALGYEEAVAGEPFYGSAGGVLTRICVRAGIDRRHVRIANVISCRPPGDFLAGAPWEYLAINQCRQYLQPEIDACPPGGVIVPLGAVAMAAILGLAGVVGVTVKDFHGTVHELKRADGSIVYVIPTYHPSHLQRGAMNLLDVVTEDFKRADRIAQRGFTRSPSELVIDPPAEWLARWCVDHLGRVDRDPDGTHLSCDTEFLEKAGGADESEVDSWNGQSPITRVNGGNDTRLGWTVPHVGAYIEILQRFFRALAVKRGWTWFWNKYADVDHLRAHGYQLTGLVDIDGMWLWHHIQSDLPRGLGFVAPMASDFGAWKHWGKVKELEPKYAAADGLQNWRTCMWVMGGAIKLGQWDVFMRDWHERDQYVLRPAYEMGVPIDRAELIRFHEELQAKLGTVLARIKETAAKGVLKPKLGYAKRPGKRCPDCKGKGLELIGTEHENICDTCEGEKVIYATTPPASILGKSKKGGGEAKLQYMTEGVKFVEAEIEVDVRCCRTCNGVGVGPKLRCPNPAKARTRRAASGEPAVVVPLPVPDLYLGRARQTRWFWQLPFNPDAPAQILAYLEQQGIEAPVDRKKQRKTTNKKALAALAKQHASDPFFQLQMDWKAVQKVDSTYAVGTLNRLDADDRVHPEVLPIPSTLRDSCRNPNLQNVVADKAGPDGLASGFRRAIIARDGLPPGVTEEEFSAWQTKWGS
jgi:DNA polymerase